VTSTTYSEKQHRYRAIVTHHINAHQASYRNTSPFTALKSKIKMENVYKKFLEQF
jgi:hypothetical protein